MKTIFSIGFCMDDCSILLAQSGFFNVQNTFLGRAMLLIVPVSLLANIFLLTPVGKRFSNKLNIKQLTILHTIKVLVEIVLYYLFVAKAIPQIVTFEVRNFDIIAGLTAPLIYYFRFIKNILSNNILIIWNLISLGLLINIVTIVILSQKKPFQQLHLTTQLSPSKMAQYYLHGCILNFKL